MKGRGSSGEAHESTNRPKSYEEPIFDASAEAEMASANTANRIAKDTTAPIVGGVEGLPKDSTENLKASGTEKVDSNGNKAVNGEA